MPPFLDKVIDRVSRFMGLERVQEVHETVPLRSKVVHEWSVSSLFPVTTAPLIMEIRKNQDDRQ